MKTNRIIKKKSYADYMNLAMWYCFLAYIILSETVTQLFALESGRLSGLILIMPIIVMLLIAILAYGGRFQIKYTYYYGHILLFASFCILSALWAENSSLALSKGFDILEIFCIMLAVNICFHKMDSVETILKALMWGYYFIVIYEIIFYGWNYFLIVMKSSYRINSEYINSNTLGMCAAFAIIINLFLLVMKKTSLLTCPFVGISTIIIAASGSRKALILLVLGILAFIFMYCVRSNSRIPIFIKGFLLLPIIILVGYQILQLPIFNEVLNRMHGLIGALTAQNIADKSSRIRLSLIELGFNLFKSHPILGIGIDNPRLHTFDVVGETYYLHNNYIELLAASGMFGFILYYWIYIKLLCSYIKMRNFSDPEYCICFFLLVITLILDYGMVSYYSKSTFIFLLLFVEYEKKLQRKKEGNSNVI